MGNYKILTLDNILMLIDRIDKPTKFIDLLNLLKSDGFIDSTNYTLLLATGRSQGINPDFIIHPYKDRKDHQLPG